MAMTQDLVAIGVFPTVAQARQAIDELHRAGYSDDEIGFLTRATDTDAGRDIAGGAVTGAVEGGVIGGLVGAAASLLIPGLGPFLAGGILAATLAGVAAGGIIGVLTAMGVSQRDAQFYQRELEAGRTIVTVKSTSGYDDALAILRRNGAYDATTQESIINATPPIRPYGSPPETYDPTAPSNTDEGNIRDIDRG